MMRNHWAELTHSIQTEPLGYREQVYDQYPAYERIWPVEAFSRTGPGTGRMRRTFRPYQDGHGTGRLDKHEFW